MLGKILENFGSWDMYPNVFGQSDCRVFNSIKWWKSLILLHVDTDSLKLKSWLKNIGMSVVRNGCLQSGYRNLILAVCQKGINEIYWFLAFWYKFRKV